MAGLTFSARKRRKKKKRHHVAKKHAVPKKKRTPSPPPQPAPKPAPQPHAPSPAPGTSGGGTATTWQTTALVATARERLFLNRFGTGFTQDALKQLRAAGTPEDWLEQQMNPSSVAESAKVAQVDGWFSYLWDAPTTKAATNSDGSMPAWKYGHNLGNWTILRRIYSRRTVLETMTDFWSTNLHIPVGHDRAWIYRADYDATIRTNVFGTFEDLLTALSLHPAMRVYLDNWSSVKGKPNENQGRELLELHTVGRVGRLHRGDGQGLRQDPLRLHRRLGQDLRGEVRRQPAHHGRRHRPRIQRRQHRRRRTGRHAGLPEVPRAPPVHGLEPVPEAGHLLRLRRSF